MVFHDELRTHANNDTFFLAPLGQPALIALGADTFVNHPPAHVAVDPADDDTDWNTGSSQRSCTLNSFCDPELRDKLTTGKTLSSNSGAIAPCKFHLGRGRH